MSEFRARVGQQRWGRLDAKEGRSRLFKAISSIFLLGMSSSESDADGPVTLPKQQEEGVVVATEAFHSVPSESESEPKHPPEGDNLGEELSKVAAGNRRRQPRRRREKQPYMVCDFVGLASFMVALLAIIVVVFYDRLPPAGVILAFSSTAQPAKRPFEGFENDTVAWGADRYRLPLLPLGDNTDALSKVDDDAHRLHRLMRVFLEGYGRLYRECRHVAYAFPLAENVADATLVTDTYDVVFTTAALPVSGQLLTPYYCINAVLQPVADAQVLTWPEQRHKWHELNGRLRRESQMPQDVLYHLIEVLSESQDITQRGQLPEPLRPYNSNDEATHTQMGYIEGAVMARNVFALEQLGTAEVDLIAYSELVAFSYLLMRESQAPACICGPHLGLPRHIVFTRRGHRVQLFLEPDIISFSGKERFLAPSDLLWQTATHRWNQRDAILQQLLGVDAQDATDTSKQMYYSSARVRSLLLETDTNGAPTGLSSRRRLQELDGLPAMCVQYCAILAHHMATRAANVTQP